MANTLPDGKSRNIIYVFVPFRFDGGSGAERSARISRVFDCAKKLCRRHKTANGRDEPDNPIWEDGADGIRSYFLKHLTDKIAPPEDGKRDGRCCIYLSAKEKSLGWSGPREADEWGKILEAQKAAFGFSMEDMFHLYQPSYMDNMRQNVDFHFRIESLRVLLFGTGIGVVAFGLVMEVEDAFDIAHAEYLLKTAIEEPDPKRHRDDKNVLLVQHDGDAARTDLTALARWVVKSAIGLDEVKFGFYSKKPRANVFSLFMADEKADGGGFEKELFYLSSGYGPGYMYPGDGVSADAQYIGDPNIRWGVSNEAACCLARPDMHPPARCFIYDSFYYKFRREYVFMYIWQLHQKYALYAFLTDVSEGGLNATARENAKSLRDYKRRFADYEANYVFARITEVVQYQRLYDAVARQFALKTMYDDVKEPLSVLDALLKEDELRAREAEQRTADGITKILAMLGLLGVASALVDSYDFIGKFFGGENASLALWVRLCQYACTAVIVVLVCWGIVYLLMRKREVNCRGRGYRPEGG